MKTPREGRSYRTEQDDPIKVWRVELARALNDADRHTRTVDGLTAEVAAKRAKLHAATDEHTSLLAWSVVGVTEVAEDGDDPSDPAIRTHPVPEPTHQGDYSSDEPCFICGRDATESPYRVVMGDGNSLLVHPSDEVEAMDAYGDVGGHTVGPTCRQKIPDVFVVKGGE